MSEESNVNAWREGNDSASEAPDDDDDDDFDDDDFDDDDFDDDDFDDDDFDDDFFDDDDDDFYRGYIKGFNDGRQHAIREVPILALIDRVSQLYYIARTKTVVIRNRLRYKYDRAYRERVKKEFPF